MTVQSPNMYDGLGVSAIGHFSMRVDFNGGEFGLPTPPKGTWYDIWISVYWSCGNDSGNSRHCISEDIYYRDYIK
ncbi:hypothetical protein RhiirA5_368459 [Rhizophagus irregularis]|uniref:Uncharacterized protein n=1 Tax=Rhizophagus irregularis TaxID=588596 RepID=A0A2I1EI53_9GLOM|nr:hypothetical protein RhiirA5_368459 [Rhizophagus irregularis]PKC67764.1 hypothetical protein RhiirA1_417730 [Rhizophagus irregularis]PKY21797.1 hypothetical protein RhiirB3_409870 [Rhizophagus irregularis]